MRLFSFIPQRIHRVALATLASVVASQASAQQVPRAVPVEDAPAAAVPRAQPVTQPASQSAGPDQDLFDYATLCYTQKDYQIAIKPYSEYVSTYPTGKHASEAWFRLGECYLKTNQNDEAKRAYNEVMTRFPRSESASSASYRLGAFSYNSRDFPLAASYFEICAKLTTSADIKLAALYNAALCYKQAGSKTKMLAAFKSVAEIKTNNNYRETALSEIAGALLADGKKEEALAAFSELSTVTKDDKVLGDALLKAGLLLNETGKAEAAQKNFRRVLSLPVLPPDQRGMAVFGITQGEFVKGDYEAVLKTYTQNSQVLPPDDLRAKQLLIVGTAQKNLKSYSEAVQTFLMLEKNFPDSPEALEAGYQKLLCFSQLGDKDVPEFTQDFENRYKEKHSKHEYLLMSRLIRADWYFTKGKYAEAAESFGGVDASKVPQKVRASVLYKKGFTEAEAGKFNDAIATLTVFLSDYPKDANAPVALAQRGIANKAVRAFDKALADFAAIVKDFPDHPAAEMAYYQSGLTKSETRDIAGMIADFEALVQKFPNSPAVPEASYRIGRGYFDLGQPDKLSKAVDPLHKAIALDSKQFLDKASQLLILVQWTRQDFDAMAKEVDAYLAARQDASISPKALIALGNNFYQKSDYSRAARYLTLATTPSQPDATDPLVWNVLGMAELENENYDAAIKALDFYLIKVTDDNQKPKPLWAKGRALLGLSKYDDAAKCAQEGLSIAKQGRLRAVLQLLDGDVSMGRGDALAAGGDQAAAAKEWQDAAADFVVVSQIFVDPNITPEAAWKAAEALEKVGEKSKADGLRKQVKDKYPNYEPKPPGAPRKPLKDNEEMKAPVAVPAPTPADVEATVPKAQPVDPATAPAPGPPAEAPPAAIPVPDAAPEPPKAEDASGNQN